MYQTCGNLAMLIVAWCPVGKGCGSNRPGGMLRSETSRAEVNFGDMNEEKLGKSHYSPNMTEITARRSGFNVSMHSKRSGILRTLRSVRCVSYSIVVYLCLGLELGHWNDYRMRGKTGVLAEEGGRAIVYFL